VNAATVTPRPGRTALLDEAGSLRERGYAWAGLAGDALAFVLARVAASGRWLVVTDGEDRAERLVSGLRFFLDPERVEPFPADDNRPYDGFSPDPAIPQQRIRTLERLDRASDLIVVAPARALLQRVPAPEVRRGSTLVLDTGARLDRDALVAHLVSAGYLGTTAADAPGRFAVRGDVVDVWPAGTRAPIRVDFFDEEIESLRRLDPHTLHAARPGRRVTLLPAAEERLDDAALTRALDELTRMIADSGHPEGTVRRRQVVEELRAGIRFSGLQDWLPALVPTVAPLDLLAGLQQVVVLPDDIHAALRSCRPPNGSGPPRPCWQGLPVHRRSSSSRAIGRPIWGRGPRTSSRCAVPSSRPRSPVCRRSRRTTCGSPSSSRTTAAPSGCSRCSRRTGSCLSGRTIPCGSNAAGYPC
jgi:transcription-repair coupling factor (superfamily II helicase)